MDPCETILFSPRKKKLQLIIILLYILFVGNISLLCYFTVRMNILVGITQHHIFPVDHRSDDPFYIFIINHLSIWLNKRRVRGSDREVNTWGLIIYYYVCTHYQ